MRKYATTWIVFLFLLIVVCVVFALTKVAKTNTSSTPMKYEQLVGLIRKLPSEIKQIQIINNEPVVLVWLKNESGKRQVIVPMEAKADLIKEIEAAQITLKTSPPDKSASWWGFQMGPLTWFFRD